ncbi:MAG: hypothetical protein AB9836_03480 [Aminipila sp.]
MEWLNEKTGEVSYMYDEIYTLVSWSRPILIVLGILFITIAILLFSLHKKVDLCLKNQEVLHEEIKDIKKLLRNSSIKGELKNGRDDECSNQGNNSSS